MGNLREMLEMGQSAMQKKQTALSPDFL